MANRLDGWCTTLGWVDQHVTKCSRAATLALVHLPLIYIKRDGWVSGRQIFTSTGEQCVIYLHEMPDAFT